MHKLSPHHNGLRIGLLGGSFNPPHHGHVDISLCALNHLALDFIWWLVSPGNPLKDPALYTPVIDRMAAARQLVSHPRIRMTSLESSFGTRYTDDILAHLQQRLPGTRFVWLMGTDNAAEFHNWRHYVRIAHRVPIALIRRPGSSFAPLSSRLAQQFGSYRLPLYKAGRLVDRPAPCWVYLPFRDNALSSRAIRAGVLPDR